jgi:UDP-2,3-diacylglucosamine pyrophosphatase LpxH
VSGAKDLFIFLDSGNATHGKRQLEWLKEVLQHRSDFRHVVVSTHTCLFRTSYNYSTTPAANLPLDEYYQLLDLMDENQVSLFLMGHFHHQEEHMIGRVPYVLLDNLNEDKDTPSYLVVTLGNEVNYKYCEL